MQGRRCDIPKQHYFVPSLHIIHEAEIPPAECESDQSYGVCFSRNAFKYKFRLKIHLWISELHNSVT